MHLRILLGLGLLALAAPARAGTLRGAVVDAQTREPLAGVTIVVSATSGAASETAISEEDGSFVVEVPAGTYLITYFYGDLTIERRDVVIGADGQVDLVQALDSSLSYDDTGCYFGPAVPFLYDGAPADHGTRAPADVPLVREPDHLALAGLDARLGPRHAATTVDGAVRLPGAPAIAGELLTEVAVASTAPAIALPGATGGTIDATLRHGSNQHRGRRRARARAARPVRRPGRRRARPGPRLVVDRRGARAGQRRGRRQRPAWRAGDARARRDGRAG